MIGSTISHYKIVKKLGQGGMGVVYQAEDTKLHRAVALKFLSPQALGSEDGKARFIREAQAAAALDHPNICTTYEIDEADGRIFIAMAFISGRSLKEIIMAGPQEPSAAVETAIQIAQGLQEAHENGIVHRDIKPANVMVSRKGQAKVMDFGLAKLTGYSQLTKTGMTLGTAAYMAPEQALGDAIDQRADIWSLGVVLYEMVAGQVPFTGEYEQVVRYSVINEEAPPLSSARPDAPKELENVIAKALAKRPEDRYASVDDMLADLRAIAAELEPAGRKVRGVGGGDSGWVSQHWNLVLAGAGVLIGLLIGAAVAFWLR